MIASYRFPIALVAPAAAVLIVLPPAAQALSPAEVSKTAKDFTVRIKSQTSGSGVILKQQGETYTVLTAAHVVATEDDYQIFTPDRREHRADPGSIKKLPGLDLAIVQFSSSQSYETAPIGKSEQATEGTVSYIAGFPNRTEALSESIYNFTEGKITASASRPQAEGYSLVYSNSTLPGMSGGPVLNEDGQLIAIHGRADTTEQAQNPSIDPSIYIKTGFNLGIPINNFLRLAPQTGVDFGFAAPAPQPVPTERSADDYYLQARQKMEAKNYKGAIADFDQAIRLRPSYVEAYLNRGYLHLTLNNADAALADSNQVIERAPNQSTAYLLRGFAYSLSSQNINKAQADFKRAKDLAQERGDQKTSQTAQKMIATFDESSRTSRTSPELKSSIVRSSLHLANKDLEGTGRELLTMANVSCKEQDLSGYLTAKMMLRLLMPSDIQEAIRPQTTCPTFVSNQTKLIGEATQAIEKSPNDLNAYMKRGMLHAEVSGDEQQAIPDFQKAAELSREQNNSKGLKGIMVYLDRLQR